MAALIFFFLAMPHGVFAAADTVQKTRDRDHDGKIDTWTTYDSSGNVTAVAIDKHKDGKPDYWKYYQNNKVVRREWDRNFDGQPDLRTVEADHHLIETQYDDNFDGKFEKTLKAPPKGTPATLKGTRTRPNG